MEVADTGEGDVEPEERISEAVAARDSRGPREVRARFEEAEVGEFRSEGSR